MRAGQELEGLSENHNYLDLSLSTLTQQNIEKEKAAKKLEDARKERIEIEISNSSNSSDYVNVAKFLEKQTITKEKRSLLVKFQYLRQLE